MHVSFLHALTPQTMASLDPVWWSLTPTVVFYCLFPFILLKLPWVSQRLVLFGVFALISLVTRLYPYIVQIIPDPPSFFLYVLDMAQAYVFIYIFLAGVLLRMLVEYLNSRPASQLRLRLARLATAFFLIGAVSIVALLYLGMKHPIIAAAQGQTPWPLAYTTIELIVIAFFASAMLGSPLLRVVPKWRFLAFTGVISYSLFLLHNTVLVMVATPYFLPAVRDWLVGRGSLAVWATFSGYTLVTLAIAFTLSYLGYRYIESPFLSYKPK
jgi:peptidoglycan/LPS O-acetylase OafA/YrhL